MSESRDSPYPELKKSHTMAHTGRPWTDHKPPSSAPVWAAIEGLARYHVLLAALELDLFDTIGSTGPVDAPRLARITGTSAPHLRSLLDAVVALGLLEQIGGLYGLNDTARRYLVSDGPATMADLVAVAPGPHDNWGDLAEAVRRGGPARPIEDDPVAFYVPLAEGTFTTMARCAARADLRIRYSALHRPRVLDLGAGGAPWAIAVLNANPGATAVINDLPGVLEVARRKVADHGLDARVEYLPGDFHTVPLAPGSFDIVVLGHICRTEGAEGARHLIGRAHHALREGGTVIVADYFVDPEHKSNPHAVLMGTTMMAATRRGLTFTYGQFAEWLREAGFESLRLIEPIGFQQQFVATRPRTGHEPEGGR